MSEQEQSSDPGEEYSPGGIIYSADGDTILAWIRPGEKYFTAADLRRMRESSGEEWNEGEVP